MARILITGGAGFIGSHLAEALLAGGHEVCVLDDLSTGTRENLTGPLGDRRFTFVEGDVCNATTLAPQLADCDVLYHLAAAVGVQLIVDQPVHTLSTNIHGSEVVLELAAREGVQVILASTSEVYGKSTAVPFREEDDMVLGATTCPRWSYACSKMVDEFLALAYHQERGLPVTACRFFNTIGPRQTGQYGMVVPRFVSWALAGEPIEVYGTGEQSRCFCHVADVVGALVQLMDCPAANGQVVNVGSDHPISMNELARRVIALTGSASEIRHIPYEQAYGQEVDDLMVRQPSLSKLREWIGYAPRYSLDETLADVVAWKKRGSRPC